MVFIFPNNVYLQILLLAESQKYLRFAAVGKVFQFRMTCIGLTEFTRAMTPILVILLQWGIQIICY